MGNYASSNTELNPLQIPDSCFQKYGLNEEKTVLIFQPCSSREYTENGIPYKYDYTIRFMLSVNPPIYSHHQTFHSQNEVIPRDSTESYCHLYDKNLGYICLDSPECAQSLAKKYKIGKFSKGVNQEVEPSPKPVQEQSQVSPSVNL